MDFHLEFTPKSLARKITLDDSILLMGSCFTENIGEKLRSHKFKVLQNPNGILFNPVSVVNALNRYMDNVQFATEDLFYLNEAYHSWEHHSRFSATDQGSAITTINASITTAHHFLKNANFLMLTLGSAWVYELTPEAPGYRPDKVAANNHKASSKWFHKRLLSADEVYTILKGVTDKLKIFNPGMEILFTVSPVRHLREGFVENNRSKASLISAVHKLIDELPGTYYFPAYELVIDDLRDYRFYAEDLVHPNYAATNYVWEKFVDACVTDDSRLAMKEINEINAARSHKPFNPTSDAHKKFLRVYQEKLLGMIKRFPNLDFEEDAAFFEKGLQ